MYCRLTTWERQAAGLGVSGVSALSVETASTFVVASGFEITTIGRSSGVRTMLQVIREAIRRTPTWMRMEIAHDIGVAT